MAWYLSNIWNSSQLRAWFIQNVTWRQNLIQPQVTKGCPKQPILLEAPPRCIHRRPPDVFAGDMEDPSTASAARSRSTESCWSLDEIYWYRSPCSLIMGISKGVETCSFYFSRMRSEGSRFTWGSGGEAVFAKSCVCDRNRRQPFAAVRNRLRWRRKALHSGKCVWSGPEIVSSWFVSPQIYWRLQKSCLCEGSVSPQLYWCLQRRRLWEWSVSPQLYWCLQRRCLWEWSVSPQFYWRLQRKCLW